MRRVVKSAAAVPGVLAFVLVLAMMPLVLQEAPGGTLHFNWGQGFQGMKDYFVGLGTGESFAYYSGITERSFWAQIGGYFLLSLAYVSVGAVLGMLVGISIGILFAASKSEWWKRVIEVTGILPDFVVIILLQFLIVKIARATGVVLFKIANFTSNDPAIVLPLISMIIVPGLYMIRNVALQMRLTFTEDYIGYAKSRGLGKSHIMLYHALPNVLPFIKADLHKFAGILVGNLFIVEYFYNLRGLTRLLFSDAFAYWGYQYDLVVNGLLALLVLYMCIYGMLRLFLRGWEKVFVR